MPRLHSSRHVISVLESKGFFFISQKGSHVKYRKVMQDEVFTTIVPAQKREIPQGTFRSILRQSHLDESDF